MKVAVVSDVHGNRHAFEAVLEDLSARDPESVWCLGDIVGYGADPDDCVALAQRHADICLAGNHDLAVAGLLDLAEFSRGAELAARWTRDAMAPEGMDWLASLEPQDLEQAVALYHASPRDPVWEYVLSTLQAELCLDVQRRRVALIGHSHVALSFNRPDGRPATGQTRAEGAEVDIAAGEWLLNPGSVGQPRDGDPRAAWLELDTEAWRVRYHRVEYDIAGAAAAIRAARLPESLAERLRHGQ